MMKEKIKMNVIDRAVSIVSPEKGLRRYQARKALAIVGGYDNGRKRRKKRGSAGAGDPDSDILPDLPDLRQSSRDALRNNPIASGAVTTVCINSVGSGLRLQSRVDRDVLKLSEEKAKELQMQIEREFRLWSESKKCDVAEKLNFYEMQDLAFRQAKENGDSICVLPRVESKFTPYSLRMQLIEGDRICNSQNCRDKSLDDGSKLISGIEKDKYGKHIKYHIAKSHPGSQFMGNSKEWNIVDAWSAETGLPNIIHLYHTLRPDQTRGVPYLAPVIESFSVLKKYADAELIAAAVASYFTVFIKSADGTTDPIERSVNTGEFNSDGTDETVSEGDLSLSPGKVVALAADEEIFTANPGRPNPNYDVFIVSVLRDIGVGLNLPLEVLIKHFRSSFSAARGALNEAWRYYRYERNWFATNFCDQIFEVLMYETVARGRINAPGFFKDPLIRKAYLNCLWVGPGAGHINPAVEANAMKTRIKAGITTVTSETREYNGASADHNFEVQKYENEKLIEAGLREPREDKSGTN